MMRITFFILLLCSSLAQAQYSYNRIECSYSDSLGQQIYKFSPKDSICIKTLSENGRQCLQVEDLNYKADNCDEQLEYAVFANAKEKKAILFINKAEAVSLGCEMFVIERHKATFCGFIPVAAYTKDPDGRMDYNNIIPYISIVKVAKRYLLAFETSLIVLYPSGDQEEILNGRDVSYSLQNGVLQLNR